MSVLPSVGEIQGIGGGAELKRGGLRGKTQRPPKESPRPPRKPPVQEKESSWVVPDQSAVGRDDRLHGG